MAFPELTAILPAAVAERIAPLLNGRGRTLALAGAAGALAIVVMTVLWSWDSYSVLYAGLSPEEGGRAIAELQKLNVPYRTAEGGRVILVPSSDLGPARLQLALHGVPKQDDNHWSLLDNESLGVSPFIEQVHYVRAIEAALSRTIREVDGVVSATIKLAVPKQTDFLADAPKPSASVMVRVQPGLQLSAGQVDGIAGLVAASVPGLTHGNVTIVDQSGRVLHQSGPDGLLQVPQQLGIARDMEHRYAALVTDLLVPILGRGNFRVSVDVDIDFSRSKESTVKYGEAHVLSQDETIHPPRPPGEAAIGIPGALSNRPPETPSAVVAAPTPPAAADAAKAPEKPEPSPAPDTHRTTNYDIDHTVQYVERPSWVLRSLNVAVLINPPNDKPIPAERLQSIKTLVSSAVGAGQNRSVAIVDLPFDVSAPTAFDAPAWWRERWMAVVEQNAMLALAGVLLLFGGLLPMLRWLQASEAALTQSLTGRRAQIGNPAVARRMEAVRASRRHANTNNQPAGLPSGFNVDAETVRSLAINQPDLTAKVIKEWIARDRNRLKQAG